MRKSLKKISALILIFLMTINVTVFVAYATDTVLSKDFSASDNSFTARVNIAVDKTTVGPGESFKFNLSIENVSNADSTKLENFFWTFATYAEKTAYTKVVNIPSPTYDEGLTYTSTSFTKPTMLKLENNSLDSYNISDLKAGLEFTVLDTVNPTTLTFTNSVNINSLVNATSIQFDPITITITDTPTPDPEPVEATYTVSAKPSADSVYAGDTFTVDVVASADKTADIAAADAVLQYDKELVKPIKAEAKTLTKGEALYYTDGKNGVEADGQGRLTTWGDTASVGPDGLVLATYTFEALQTGNAQFSIAEGAKIGKSGETAEFAATSGAAASVEIKNIPDEKVLIANSDYKGAPDGKQVLKYIAQSMPAEGSAYFYGDDAQPLYYAGDDSDGKHVFLGFVDASLTLDTLASVSEKTGSYETLSVDGDLNGSGSVNAVDSLIAYDLASGVYSSDADMSKLSAKARLEADINRDGKVDAADARAIMYKALRINDTSTL